MTIRQTGAIGAALTLFGCNAATFANAPVTARPTASPVRSPIKHVVFIIQENRSFNNLFFGYPGATTQAYGYDTSGHKIRLRRRPLSTTYDIGHWSSDFFSACNGRGALPGTKCRMDGWNNEQIYGPHPLNAAYSYVARHEIEPYWTMAREYVLSDRTFASNLDGSFIAHQYVVAAYASRGVDYPYTNWGCEGGKHDTLPTLTSLREIGSRIPACFDNPTIASEADAAEISWRFYAGSILGDGGIWSSYQANRQIYYGRDWNTNVINPPARFLRDVTRGKLAAITWITPTSETSDHPGLPNASEGPAWVASVVDAVGTSPFWSSTAIFVMWDDWGGFFDPVQPVYEDYDGLGFRVPLLVISPYAKHGSVTHVQYETASVLRFTEDNFGLATLAASDARAADPAADAAAFDFNQAPRAFNNIPGAKPYAYWLRVKHSSRAEEPSRYGIGGD